MIDVDQQNVFYFKTLFNFQNIRRLPFLTVEFALISGLCLIC